jgi:hypothetical protein
VDFSRLPLGMPSLSCCMLLVALLYETVKRSPDIKVMILTG